MMIGSNTMPASYGSQLFIYQLHISLTLKLTTSSINSLQVQVYVDSQFAGSLISPKSLIELGTRMLCFFIRNHPYLFKFVFVKRIVKLDFYCFGEGLWKCLTSIVISPIQNCYPKPSRIPQQI